MVHSRLEFQFKDPSKLWFGTFKNDIYAPDPDQLFPPKVIHFLRDYSYALYDF